MMQALHAAARPDPYRPVAHIDAQAPVQDEPASPDSVRLIAEIDGAPVGLCFTEMRTRTCMMNRLTATTTCMSPPPSAAAASPAPYSAKPPAGFRKRAASGLA